MSWLKSGTVIEDVQVLRQRHLEVFLMFCTLFLKRRLVSLLV